MASETKTICSGVVLTGGLNTRMEGQNKALLQIKGKSFLDIIVDALSCCFNECLVVTREPARYPYRRLTLVEDIFTVRTPLAGIHAALVNMKSDYAFCTSCDVPLLKPDVIRILINEIEPGIDVVVPASEEYYQPLCAVYSKRCVPFIEDQLRQGDLKTDHLFDKITLKKIPYEHFEAFDPDLHSFFNVNTKADLYRANQLIDAEQNEPSN
jgi:molybdopterin-guanine dinucleotide biosynthesis protein A